MKFVMITIGTLLHSPLIHDRYADAFSAPILQSKIPSTRIHRTNDVILKSENDFQDGIGLNNDLFEEYTQERTGVELTNPPEFG